MRKMLKTAFGRFADWVDSFGEDAGDNMIAGALIAGILVSAVAMVWGIMTANLPLGAIGFVFLIVQVFTYMDGVF